MKKQSFLVFMNNELHWKRALTFSSTSPILADSDNLGFSTTMKSKSDSISIVRTSQGINSNSSISELMEFTRTAFQKSDYEMVKRILEDREKKKDKFEADNCDLIRQKFETEDEVESLKKTAEEKDAAIVKLETDISELQQRLESRVLCLEKDVASMKEQLQVPDEEIKQNDEADQESSKEASGNQSPTRNIAQSLNNIILIYDSDDEEKTTDETNPVKSASLHGGDDVNLPAGKLTDDDEVVEINLIPDSSLRKRKRVVCSDDDDDDVSVPDGAKKTRSPPCDDDGVNVPAGVLVADMANAGPVIRSCDEIPKGGKVDLSVVNSDDDEDLTDACLNKLAADPSPKSVIENTEKTNNSRVWAHDMEMKKAFENEDELCLNAVCALFWETQSDVEPSDAGRVTELVKVLIDGDPNGKITKSSSELKKTRPSIVDDCRKLADFYSQNLFQIYKNKKNPFFPCPKFQTC